jgi:predicted site-specific integrase-resolvase
MELNTIIEMMYKSYGVEIIHIEKNDVTQEEDLVTDII